MCWNQPALNHADLYNQSGAMAGSIETYFPVIPGWDIAGVVERAGPRAPDFAPGDKVIGYIRSDVLRAHGGLAQLVSADVRTLTSKPPPMSWHEAAGLPLAGLTAYQAVVRTLGARGDSCSRKAAGQALFREAKIIASRRGLSSPYKRPEGCGQSRGRRVGGGLLSREVGAEVLAGAHHGLEVEVEIALSGLQGTVTGDQSQDVRRNSRVRHQCQSGVPRVARGRRPYPAGLSDPVIVSVRPVPGGDRPDDSS